MRERKELINIPEEIDKNVEIQPNKQEERYREEKRKEKKERKKKEKLIDVINSVVKNEK